MGCWNETCIISNLPILGGKECAAAILLGFIESFQREFIYGNKMVARSLKEQLTAQFVGRKQKKTAKTK